MPLLVYTEVDPPCRDVAQPGRALAWGARGRQFKSARPDHLNQSLTNPTNAGDRLAVGDFVGTRLQFPQSRRAQFPIALVVR